MNMKTTVKLGLGIIMMGFLANILWGGNAGRASTIPALVKAGALVIDVRSAGEFSSGHLDEAIHIPHTEVAQKIAQYEKNKSRTLIVYCRSGGRAEVAKQALEQAGYTEVINGGSLSQMRKALKQ